MTDEPAAPVNGSPVEDQPAPRRKMNADEMLLNHNVTPIMRQVFGDKAAGMTLAKAVNDSRFRNMLMLDLYMRMSRAEIALQQIYAAMMEASEPPAPQEQPRILRPV